MAFIEILKDLVTGLNGGMAATIMGTDGLSLEHFSAPKTHYDVDLVAVEYGKVISEIKNAAEVLSLGELEEIVVKTPLADVILQVISPEYYIILVIAQDANVGKARYLLRRAAVKTRKELAQ